MVAVDLGREIVKELGHEIAKELGHEIAKDDAQEAHTDVIQEFDEDRDHVLGEVWTVFSQETPNAGNLLQEVEKRLIYGIWTAI